MTTCGISTSGGRRWRRLWLLPACLLALPSIAAWPDGALPDLAEAARKAEALTGLLERIGQANSEQQRILRDLNQKLTLSEADARLLREISETQGAYANRLLEEAKTQRGIYEAQLSYQKKLRLRSTVLTVSLAAGLPLAAGLGLWLGWALGR